jgi:hypothetical protein
MRFPHPAARFFFHSERELTRLHGDLASKIYGHVP